MDSTGKNRLKPAKRWITSFFAPNKYNLKTKRPTRAQKLSTKPKTRGTDVMHEDTFSHHQTSQNCRFSCSATAPNQKISVFHAFKSKSRAGTGLAEGQ